MLLKGKMKNGPTETDPLIVNKEEDVVQEEEKDASTRIKGKFMNRTNCAFPY